jgi:hypothetical protein
MDLLGNPGIAEPLKVALDYVIAFGTDFFAFIIVAGAIATLAFYFGRDRLVSLIAAIYSAIVLYRAFPYGSMLPADNAYVQIGMFVGFVLISLIAFSGLSFFLARSTSSFFGTAVLSAVTAGLILSVSIHVLPVQTLYSFSAPTLALFASPEMFFWWLVAPLAGLFFFGR